MADVLHRYSDFAQFVVAVRDGLQDRKIVDRRLDLFIEEEIRLFIQKSVFGQHNAANLLRQRFICLEKFHIFGHTACDGILLYRLLK